MTKKLRSGYTTGACAAAAARAACTALLREERINTVDVVFPDERVVSFDVTTQILDATTARASIIKDAGDDPDVTNGAEIVAEITISASSSSQHEIIVKGGTGVGMVTKPGLPVAVGSPAINPVPMRMIEQNVRLALEHNQADTGRTVDVTIIVPRGLELAGKTLNERLGIVGGISILGTTGIVKPVSADAWTATIISSMDVASANNVTEIVLSTGRTSERCYQETFAPPEEALVMMGDYLEFSLKAARKYPFTTVHIATMWGKLLKGAMGYKQTHVRHGALDTGAVEEFFKLLGIDHALVEKIEGCNTAREILEILEANQARNVIKQVCEYARSEYEKICSTRIAIHLVDGQGRRVCSTED